VTKLTNRMRVIRAAALGALVVLGAACAGEKAFREGQDAESLGRWDEAVSSYAKAHEESPKEVRYKMAFDQVLWTQNETRRLPNPRAQFPTAAEASQIARGRDLFSNEVTAGGAGCASCHHNGNQTVDGATNDTLKEEIIGGIARNESRKAVDKLQSIAKNDADPKMRQRAIRRLSTARGSGVWIN